MRFQLIHDQRQSYPIQLMCRVLEVSRSGYYAWRKRKPSARQMANDLLLAISNQRDKYQERQQPTQAPI